MAYSLDDNLETEVLDTRGGDEARFRDVATKLEMNKIQYIQFVPFLGT